MSSFLFLLEFVFSFPFLIVASLGIWCNENMDGDVKNILCVGFCADSLVESRFSARFHSNADSKINNTIHNNTVFNVNDFSNSNSVAKMNDNSKIQNSDRLNASSNLVSSSENFVRSNYHENSNNNSINAPGNVTNISYDKRISTLPYFWTHICLWTLILLVDRLGRIGWKVRTGLWFGQLFMGLWGLYIWSPGENILFSLVATFNLLMVISVGGLILCFFLFHSINGIDAEELWDACMGGKLYEKVVSNGGNPIRLFLANLQIIFADTKDFVFSELILGLMLVKDLQLKQAHMGKIFCEAYDSDDVKFLYTDDDEMLEIKLKKGFYTAAGVASRGFQPRLLAEDWNNLRDAQYFMKFAEAVYGSPHFVFAYPCNSCMLLGSCCTCSAACCNLNMQAILSIAQISESDIIFSQPVSEYGKVVFYALKDNTSKSLVIAIRGTLSFEDCITNAHIEAKNLGFIGLADHYSHSGFLDAALNIFNELEHKKVLENFFLFHPEFNLVLCGHSLGAATAALLAIMLRKSYRLKCFSYGIPLCIDTKLAESCSDYITSIVYQNDLVCRLSLQSLFKLKESMKWCLKNAKIESSVLDYYSFTCRESSADVFSHMSKNSILFPTTTPFMSGFNEGDVILSMDHEDKVIAPLFFLPGKVFHVLAVNNKNNECVAYRAKNCSFNEIAVDLNMMRDHLPFIYSSALSKIRFSLTSSDQLF